MAQVKNNTLGTRYIGDVRILAGKTEEVPDADMKGVVVQAWLNSGDIELAVVDIDHNDDHELIDAVDTKVVKAK